MPFQRKRHEGPITRVPVNELPGEIAPPVPDKLQKIDPGLDEWRKSINRNWQEAVKSINRKNTDTSGEA